MRTSSKPWLRKENMTWYVELGGKQISLGKDKAEAKRKWVKLLAEGGLPKDRPLRECVEHYLPTLAPKTRRTREQTLYAFLKHTGEIKVGKLANHHVSTFIRPNWSASTTRGHIKTIIACLSMAAKHGLIEKNPVKDVEKPAWERRVGPINDLESVSINKTAARLVAGRSTA